MDHALVPLAPLARWVADHWDPLFHEGHLPAKTTSGSAAEWYTKSLDDVPEDEDAFDGFMMAREAWWCRHGLGSALPGFRIPDLVVRRVDAGVELSWDDREWRAVPRGVQLSHASGAVALPEMEVANVFYGWALSLVEALVDVQEAAAFCEETRRLLASHKDSPSPLERMTWAAGRSVETIENAARALQRLAGATSESMEDAVRALFGLSEDEGCGLVTPITVPAMLFRAANPAMSIADLSTLSRAFSSLEPAVGLPISDLQRKAPPPMDRESATQDGCAKALEIRAALAIDDDAPLLREHDLETEVLPRLGVVVHEFSLEDRQVDGAAMFAPGKRPMVAVNLSGRFSSTKWGRRMTLAHELCHLLYDLSDNGGVGVVSNPWAPYLLERRANAFAAMFLMPHGALEAALPRDSRDWTPELLHGAMTTLGVGRSALTWHLYNLKWISDSERRAWLDVL